MTEPQSKKPSLDRETWLIILTVLGGILVTLSLTTFSDQPISSDQRPGHDSPKTQQGQSSQRERSAKPTISTANVPLATGDEPIPKLFIQSGCAACHTIPGILAAKGREGPRLILGLNGPKRLADPNYQGTATTVHEYIMESILYPGAYVVPGYPDRVMPRWYGKKLSASALDKMVAYLERVTE